MGLLRYFHGRGMNGLSEVYKLPADREEMERLSLQHRIWVSMLGGLYPQDIFSSVEEILSGKDGEQPAVLDIGSGSGAWAIDMAYNFPNARIVGLDLAAENMTDNVPENCTFIKADATKGLSQFAGQFDLIHTRSVLGHIEDVYSVIRDVYACLKPGGIYILAEGNFRAYDEHKCRLMAVKDDDTDFAGKSWLVRYMEEMGLRMATHNRKESAGEVADQWIQRTGLFGEARSRAYFSPIGWDGGDGTNEGRELGEITKRNMLAFIQAGKPNLLSDGTASELVDCWIKNSIEEINNLSPKLYVKWNVAWARTESH